MHAEKWSGHTTQEAKEPSESVGGQQNAAANDLDGTRAQMTSHESRKNSLRETFEPVACQNGR